MIFVTNIAPDKEAPLVIPSMDADEQSNEPANYAGMAPASAEATDKETPLPLPAMNWQKGKK